jgi:Fe-S cluster biogenesis protein NfuA
MSLIKVVATNHANIFKFEFPDLITRDSFEFKNIDDTANSLLAKKLFYLPFVKTVYISRNFVAIEKFNIVEWDDVKDEIANQLEAFYLSKEPIILLTESQKKQPFSVYSESTPNPHVMKFVANKVLTTQIAQYQSPDETESSPLAKALFNFPFVKEVFIDENYVSVNKHEVFDWAELTNEVRSFIKTFLENDNPVVINEKLVQKPRQDKQTATNFDALDSTSQQIINIIEEYIKPAVQQDGGNILFDSYNEDSKLVKVILQGSCNGCPSSTFTLKNGMENLLKKMLNDEKIVVEAV